MKSRPLKAAVLFILSGLLILGVAYAINWYSSTLRNPSDLGTISELSLHQELSAVDHVTVYGGYSQRILITSSNTQEINVRLQGNPESLKSNIANRHFIVGEPFEIVNDPRCHWLFGCKDVDRLLEVHVEIPSEYTGTITIVSLNPTITVTNEFEDILWNRLTIRTANATLSLQNISTDIYISTANLTLNASRVGGSMFVSSAALSGFVAPIEGSDLHMSIQSSSTNLRLEQFPDEGVLISSTGVNSYIIHKDGRTERSLANLIVNLRANEGDAKITLDIQSVSTALRFVP